MKILMRDWPFKKDEKVVLHWIRSPKMEGENKQWVIQVVFKSNGSFIPVKFPWGLLPYLRIGSTYVNGERGIMDANLIRRDINFQQTVSTNFKRAGDVIHKFSYLLSDSVNLAQMCLYIQNGNENLIVPCIEIIRAYLCPNKTMCEALLDPIGLQEIVSVKAVSNNKFKLEFTNITPVDLLNSKDFLVRIAHILIDKNLRNTWDSVWNSLNHSYEKVISCVPPDLSNTQWSVVGIPINNGFLVTEILKIQHKSSSLIREIDFSHPKLVKQNLDISQHGNRIVHRSIPKHEEVSLRRDSPKNFRNPRMVNDLSSIFQTGNNIKVNKILRDPKIPFEGTAEKAKRIVRLNAKVTEEISFNDVAGRGNVQAAEFKNINTEVVDNISSCFHEIARAILYMSQSRGYQVDFVEDSISVYSGQNRNYLLVCIVGRHRNIWILEMDQLQSNSTLIFIAENDEKSTGKAMALHLIDRFLSPRGWDRDGVEKLIGKGVHWAKHTTSFAISWGERLGNKVNNLDRKYQF